MWDRSRISISTCVCLSICLYFCMRLQKPRTQMQIEDEADTRESNTPKTRFTLLYCSSNTYTCCCFFYTEHTRTLTQTTYNAISSAQWLWTLNTHFIYCCCCCFLHFSFFFSSFFGFIFIRLETNGWVFEAIELYFAHKHTHTHAIQVTHTHGHVAQTFEYYYLY